MTAGETDKPDSGASRTATVPRIASAGQLAMRARVPGPVLQGLLALAAYLVVFIVGFALPLLRHLGLPQVGQANMDPNFYILGSAFGAVVARYVAGTIRFGVVRRSRRRGRCQLRLWAGPQRWASPSVEGAGLRRQPRQSPGLGRLRVSRVIGVDREVAGQQQHPARRDPSRQSRHHFLQGIRNVDIQAGYEVVGASLRRPDREVALDPIDEPGDVRPEGCGCRPAVGQDRRQPMSPPAMSTVAARQSAACRM